MPPRKVIIFGVLALVVVVVLAVSLGVYYSKKGSSSTSPGPSSTSPGPTPRTPGPSSTSPGPTPRTPGPTPRTPGPTPRTPAPYTSPAPAPTPYTSPAPAPTPCQPGFFRNTYDESCVPCDVGTYKNTTGDGPCRLCPPGTTSSFGTTSSSRCLPQSPCQFGPWGPWSSIQGTCTDLFQYKTRDAPITSRGFPDNACQVSTLNTHITLNNNNTMKETHVLTDAERLTEGGCNVGSECTDYTDCPRSYCHSCINGRCIQDSACTD